MFIIEYEKYGHNQKLISTDVKDVSDIIAGIANNIKTEVEAYNWVCNAHFGDNFVNQKYKFAIKCVYDENNIYPPNDIRNKQPDFFRDKRKLQVVADEITRQTGIDNEFIGEDNDSLTWDFATGVSYMKNNGGKGLYFALNDDNGVEICDIVETDVKEFIRKTVTVIKRREMSKNKAIITKGNIPDNRNTSTAKKEIAKKVRIMHNKDIITEIKKAITDRKEWHARIYEDGCWWIDLERHPYGQIRFWVGFEDKRSGNCNGSIYSIYRYEGNLRYSCEFRVKKVITDKIESVFKLLEKEKIIGGDFFCYSDIITNEKYREFPGKIKNIEI